MTTASASPTQRIFRALMGLALVFTLAGGRLAAQTILRDPSQTLSLSKGASILMINAVNWDRVTVGDPDIAELLSLGPTEVLINGLEVGSTTMIMWELGGGPVLYRIEVTADAAGIERYLRALLDEEITVTASGNSVTLSGNLKDALSVERAVAIAGQSGAQVIDNMIAPPAQQVLLHVRFAEVNLSAMRDWSTAFSTLNPQDLDSDGDWFIETISSGIIRALLSNPNANIEALINASASKGNFKTLAEPNLLTLPGREATFLAGGEFPYPSIQSGASGNAVSVVFKEFGVRLRFTPTITRSGAIRLKVMPEVSSLDFANGLVFGGFQIPSLLTRRAETEVELREGQFLALAGLLDQTSLQNVTKIPLLGDIPVIGELFKSRANRYTQTELLVLVTPHLVVASDNPIALPTGEPETWQWPGWMRQTIRERQRPQN